MSSPTKDSLALSEAGKESLIPVIFNGQPQFPNKKALSKTRIVQDTVEKKCPVVSVEDDPLQQEWAEFLEDFPHCSRYLEPGFLDNQFPALRQRLEEDGTDEFGCQVDIGGFDAEDISVNVKDGNVTVTGKKETLLDDGETYRLEERSTGMRLPENVSDDQVSSELTEDMKVRVSVPAFDDSRPCSSASADSSLAER
ncbi:heat shock protein 30-like [Ornithodoros turicata]|uniref:heat shock protein 30-like n=1 Tax=Ornithodoros turicata TaxID=34597 RepID=UPI00313888E1